MKLKRSSLKELIRQSIDELKEGGPGSGPGGNGDNPFDKEPSDDELADIEKEFEGVNESVKSRRFTVKEVQKWMKTLEENRYKKVYNSDCRRVAWMVNNMNEDVSNMPESMSKKWTKAQYGRERYLAKEFLKSKIGEEQLKESIRKIVGGLITEAQQEKFGVKYSNNDHYVIHKSLKQDLGIEDGVDWSESFDVYGWNDQMNFEKAVGELNNEVLKLVKPLNVAKQKLDNVWKVKEKIFKKWRKKDGSKQGD